MTCASSDDSSTGASQAPPKKLTANEVIEAFLSIAMTPPEKLPKQQYRQREIQAQIIGFNRAQEYMRQILRERGAGEDLVRLAETRNERQQRPLKVGNTNMWVMS